MLLYARYVWSLVCMCIIVCALCMVISVYVYCRMRVMYGISVYVFYSMRVMYGHWCVCVLLYARYVW